MIKELFKVADDREIPAGGSEEKKWKKTLRKQEKGAGTAGNKTLLQVLDTDHSEAAQAFFVLLDLVKDCEWFKGALRDDAYLAILRLRAEEYKEMGLELDKGSRWPLDKKLAKQVIKNLKKTEKNNRKQTVESTFPRQLLTAIATRSKKPIEHVVDIFNDLLGLKI